MVTHDVGVSYNNALARGGPLQNHRGVRRDDVQRSVSSLCTDSISRCSGSLSPKTNNHMKICVLPVSEFRAMQKNPFHRPPCAGHLHIHPEEADRLIQAEGGEWIEGQMGRRMFAYPSVVWKKVFTSMQLVKGVIQGRQGTFRYPVPAAVGHGRLQNVRAINEPLPAA
jgi:hypothetical protein